MTFNRVTSNRSTSNRTALAHLSEGQVLDDVDLTREEAAGLSTSRLVTVQPSTQGWRVTAAHAVGALRCGNLPVRVHPKVGPLQVLRLLARAHGIRGLTIDESLVEVGTHPELTTVLATLFARESVTAMADGPLRGYRTEDQSLPVLRGRLRLRDQELRRYGALATLEVTVDEWTTDTDENRRIRAASRCLLTLPDLPGGARDRLVRLDRLLAEVSVTPSGARLPPWTATRLNTRLHRLLHLADLVLHQAAVEHRAGPIEVHGFVLSMSWLFEELVTRLLAESATHVRVRGQHSTALDSLSRLTIRPDLEFTDAARVVAVADTKYKLLDERGAFPNADAYQLVTYCARLGLPVGHIIYAAGDPQPDPYDIMGTGVRLVVHSVDLDQPLPDLENRVHRLFTEIVTPASSPTVVGALSS